MIIDVLKFVIEASTGGAEDDLNRVKGSADNLERSLDDVDSTSKAAATGISSMAKAALGSLLSLGALSAVLAGVGSRQNAIADLATSARLMGESVSNVDTFSKAIESIGGSSESAISELQSLSSIVTGIFRGANTEAAQTFGFLGVQLRNADGSVKGTTQLMLELADSVKSMSGPEAQFHLGNIGISDPKIIEAMMRGRAELQRLMDEQKENNIVTEEQVERARQYQESMGKLKTEISRAGSSLKDALTPYAIQFLDVATDMARWFRDNKDLVTGFFIAAGAAITMYYLPAIIKAAIATAVAVAPFLLIGAAIAAIGVAFALAYEDVMKYLDGQDSLIGRIFDKYPKIKEFVVSTLQAIKSVFQDVMYAITNPVDAIGDAIQYVLEKLLSLKNAISDLGNWKPSFDLSSLDPREWFSGSGDDPSMTFGAPAESDVPTWMDVRNNTESARMNLGQAESTPLNSMTSSSISNMSRTTQNSLTIGEIKVETQATDAKGVANGLNSELKEQLKTFEAYNNTVVLG